MVAVTSFGIQTGGSVKHHQPGLCRFLCELSSTGDQHFMTVNAKCLRQRRHRIQQPIERRAYKQNTHEKIPLRLTI